MAEYRFPKDGWVLVRVKRDWVPERLFKALRWIAFLFPLNLILMRKATDDDQP